MMEPRRVLGVPLRASRDAGSRSAPPETGRHLVRLRPTLADNAWARIVDVMRGGADDLRGKEWLTLAREWRTSDDAAAATCLVLADLCAQGWAMELEGDAIWAMPPVATTNDGERPETVKDRLRAWLRTSRARQLEDPAVRTFIARIETPRAFGGRRVSVLDLVDDGHALSTALAQIAKLPPSERPKALEAIVRPTLHIADADATCPTTGLPLIDVWRYFRHTWSLEYRATPGRTLFFLIRNEARPNAPVMAIGALANATLQLRVRDNWIGWSAESLSARARADASFWERLRAAMLRTLNEAIEFVHADDLMKQAGAAKGAALESRLATIAAEAKQRREAEMRERVERSSRGEENAPIKRLPVDEGGRIAWQVAASSSLFIAKRAKTLADLLFSRRLLTATKARLIDVLLAAEDGQRAFAVAAREIRKVGLASRLLELNVCGAAPPYGDLLAGKLAALAVASEEMSQAYSTRYATKVSEIASQMAAREVVRASDVCVVGTTSLYGIAASQYNRLKVSVPTPDGDEELITWQDLGLTEGFGTAQFSEETVSALRDVSIRAAGGRRINNLFGEGQSPRLRQVREGLDALGLDGNGLLKHSTPRRVYSLDLFQGARERLCLNETADASRPTFAAIAEAWRHRWLSNRVTFRPALDRVAEQGPATVRADLGAPDSRQLPLFNKTDVKLTQPPPAPRRQDKGASRMRKTSNPELIQGLYRAVAACADHHDAATVRLLHIETAVDDFLRKRAKQGGAIFITGNPGDGKTHLLRHLEAEFHAAKVVTYLDANEEADDLLIDRVDFAMKRAGRGIAMAINEGVLVALLRQAADRPWARAAREQLMNPYIFRGAAASADAAVTVVDLNLRNNLSEHVIRRALDAMLKISGPCDGCPQSTCGLQMNAERIARGLPADRLIALLDAVAKAGVHATMRDVQGFLAFLLVDGYRCEDVKSGAAGRRYWENAFEGGQGPLFDAVRELDPERQTVPLLDDLLWRRAEQPNDWEPGVTDLAAAGETLDERRHAFVLRKRRALFEHTQGDTILAASGSPIDRTLAEIMQAGPSAVRKVVRLLNHFYDRDEDRNDLLYLWVTHRYDAQASRFGASCASLASTDLEMLVPALRPEIASAFPDFRPTFAILCLKDAPPSTGLRVDRPLISALLAAEQGMPSTFRRGEPEARIAAFFDRAAKRVGVPDDTIEIRLVDMDTGANHRVAVDVQHRTYVRP